MELLTQIFEICIIPLLGVLTAWACSFIRVKIGEITNNTENETEKKYLEMLNNTICDCIEATNQTYADALKEQDAFDAEAQKIAFQKTFNAVFDILADDAVEYLNECLGDLEVYVTQKIEAEIKKSKKGTE